MTPVNIKIRIYKTFVFKDMKRMLSMQSAVARKHLYQCVTYAVYKHLKSH